MFLIRVEFFLPALKHFLLVEIFSSESKLFFSSCLKIFLSGSTNVFSSGFKFVSPGSGKKFFLGRKKISLPCLNFFSCRKIFLHGEIFFFCVELFFCLNFCEANFSSDSKKSCLLRRKFFVRVEYSFSSRSEMFFFQVGILFLRPRKLVCLVVEFLFWESKK